MDNNKVNNNELYHWGILGMKWGRRRWQNKDGSLTPAGRKRYADEDEEISEEEMNQRREAYKQYVETSKQQAIRSGDYYQVSRWQHEMSNQELKDALTRIDYNKQLRDYNPTSVKTGMDTVINITSKIDTIGKSVDSAGKIYNLIAKVNNAFNKKFTLPGLNDDLIKTVDKYTDEIDKRTKTANMKKAEEEAERSRIMREQSQHDYEESKKKAAAGPDTNTEATKAYKALQEQAKWQQEQTRAEKAAYEFNKQKEADEKKKKEKDSK